MERHFGLLSRSPHMESLRHATKTTTHGLVRSKLSLRLTTAIWFYAFYGLAPTREVVGANPNFVWDCMWEDVLNSEREA